VLKSNAIFKQKLHLWKVGGLFPSTLYNVPGFSLPPIKPDHHQITEKCLSMAKNSKQSINQSINQKPQKHENTSTLKSLSWKINKIATPCSVNY
jgi:hypothetical protein